jgi:hypothetical protein
MTQAATMENKPIRPHAKKATRKPIIKKQIQNDQIKAIQREKEKAKTGKTKKQTKLIDILNHIKSEIGTQKSEDTYYIF